MNTRLSITRVRLALVSFLVFSLFGHASAQAPDFAKAQDEALHFLSELVKMIPVTRPETK